MASVLKMFAPPKHAVLSFGAHVEAATEPRLQGQFEVLVRHLLRRFFNNELLASDDEARRVMMIGYTVALPGLFVALLLFPAYHAFPPFPLYRSFWAQVGDHYFYVMYAFVIMGVATVYEWDLLFPDLLDVLILSILPMTNRRPFLGRVLALAIFLALVLFGTSFLGMVALPMIAGLPNLGLHLLAHAAAVLLSGAFAAATFLALQGFLINVVGERIFRRMAPVIQGASLMLMLAILFLDPLISRSIGPLLTSGSSVVRWFPPFWYLGIYERLLGGSAALPLFGKLAMTGIDALLLMLSCALLTYPLAYRRRVRQVIEGVSVKSPSTHRTAGVTRLLHQTIVGLPASRAVFHFIAQTVFRNQRHRVMLAMYGGLAVALSIANMVVLDFTGGHVCLVLTPDGIRAAVPVVAFWTVAGLSAAISAPVDRRGAWLFRVLLGRPHFEHYEGTRIWITLAATVTSVATSVALFTRFPPHLQTPRLMATQLMVAVGGSFLLPDLFLFPVRTFPFTHLHQTAITDFPLMILRYFVLFPVMVFGVVHYEPAIEMSWARVFAAILITIGVHLLLVDAHKQSLQRTADDASIDEADDYPQRLGLRGD